jgi:hypothetical protein
MSDQVVLYRADVQGLQRGDDTTRMVDPRDNREYTYATTNVDVARAFAVQAFGLQRDHRSVYRVELDQPIVPDPDFLSDLDTSFVMSHWGTVVDVVDETVTMTVDEARRLMSRYALWADKSPIYDADGFANVPPPVRNDSRFDAEDIDEIRTQLRQLGTYGPPPDIWNLAKVIADTRLAPRH